MHVVSVDPATCQGHARCLAFAPEVFDFDDEGYAFVPEDRSTYAELTDKVKLAIANCPERAISVSETANR
ncbi:ferredoxin [Streptomyces sp. SID8361]|uniref:ferredoxin n=1 Tax=Streptomyces sp. MnatMP-M27 TaxID=1839768 RepID=UPI00081EC6B9|nr:ferredoxin [Streptomyces sp. MnatMP-M27]MYU11092.1 ferredoxin [Streptomyces sp. SID8361]SCF78206.1 ferredoxin [Streptomyces sp. MnatMP-M27]